jgi:ATP-dependent Lhr-like helicase
MHRRSRTGRRRSVEAVSPEAFVRFLARWQHAAPGCQVGSPAGLSSVVGQLQGWPAAVASWEPELLGRRIADYQPAWIDRLCHDGELQWLRLVPRPGAEAGRRGSGPSKATPISLVHRQDLTWLLAAWRGQDPVRAPTNGAVAEVVAALAERGPRFASDLAGDTGRLPTDVEAALWEGVARGLLAADGFEAIRSLTGGPAPRRRHHRSLSRLRQANIGSIRSAGRWALVPGVVPAIDGGDAAGDDRGDDGRSGPGRSTGQATSPAATIRAATIPAATSATATSPADLHRDDLAEAVADQLLQRWGVLFYDLASFEQLALPWRELQWALRRLEDRGLVLGGRFVKGFSGEQFALPEAADALRQAATTTSSATVTVCGADPLNLTGVILPGPRVPARRGNRVTVPA